MSRDYIQTFLNQHCRFILRSGKEVFGVVWKASSQHEDKYFFSTISEHRNILDPENIELTPNKLSVNIDDIILAERIVA